MNSQLRMILVAGLLFVLLILMKAIKDKKLDLQYTLIWLGLLMALLVLVIFPHILSLISYWFGIAVPVNALFFLGFCFSVILIYRLTTVISKMSAQITRLSQEVALLKKNQEDQDKQD